MVLKTRRAFPKYYLFRKFKIDLFDFFTKGARINRGPFRFSLRWFKRYNRRKVYFLQGALNYLVRKESYRLLQSGVIRAFINQFSFLSNLKKKSHLNNNLIQNFVQRVLLSNKSRTTFINFATCNAENFNSRPVDKRFSLLFRKK